MVLAKFTKINDIIFCLRGQSVIIDADLARLYETSTKAINQAVKRNSARFPEDFGFQLSEIEKEEVVTICDHLEKLKFSRTLPYAFTEHGVLMMAAILSSKQAIDMSIKVVRTFVQMREFLINDTSPKISLTSQQVDEVSTRNFCCFATIGSVAFVVALSPRSKLRGIRFTPNNQEIILKINQLEKQSSKHDQSLKDLFHLVNKLIASNQSQKTNKVGFI